MAFRLLALAVPDPVKTEITIAYPERNKMECLLVVIIFSVNAGKVINTRRKVVEAEPLNAVQVVDPVCSPWGLVERRHVSQAFLLPFVEFIFY